MELAFIAPYELIQTKAQSIIATNGYPARTYLGDLQEGVAAARRALGEGAHIIISRGGTARLIREQLGIEVIEVGGSTQQLLSYIYEQTGPQTRIAIVGFRQILNLVQPLCDIFKRPHQTFEIKQETDLEKLFAEIGAWQPDVVIGDAISVKMARRYQLNFHLIESSMETIVDAFERGMLVLNNLKKHLANTEKLSAVLDCAKDGALLINNEGKVEEINQRGCQLLERGRTDLIGQPFADLLQGKELDQAIHKHKTTRNIIVPWRDKNFVTDYIPIAIKEEQISAVIRFQQVEEIHETDNIIRRKLREKGFFARYSFADILHQSKKVQQAIEIAKQYSKMSSNIMIQGETGTGKELFAQSIHNASPIADGPFVAINCAALTGSLLESELFGYAPGAFTGALRTGKTGLFELAHGGTLFLDEITEMDIYLQSKLLRAIQSHEIMRIGDNRVIPVKVRIIAATNRHPATEVESGNFRADLYYRLNVLDLRIPPLRERSADVDYLFSHFVKTHQLRQQLPAQPPAADILQQLHQHDWPGNVRELENMAEKYVCLSQALSNRSLCRQIFGSVAEQQEVVATTLDDTIRQAVLTTYRQLDENISRTASQLNVDRNTVKRWLSKAKGEEGQL